MQNMHFFHPGSSITHCMFVLAAPIVLAVLKFTGLQDCNCLYYKLNYTMMLLHSGFFFHYVYQKVLWWYHGTVMASDVNTVVLWYTYNGIYLCSAVKRLIAINRIQNKSFCLHNICLCTVSIYVYINTHTYIIYSILKIFTCIYMSIFIFIYFILYINIFNKLT